MTNQTSSTVSYFDTVAKSSVTI